MTDTISRLVRIETKLDAILLDDCDHEVRLRSLERDRWVQRGIMAILSLVVAKLHLPIG